MKDYYELLEVSKNASDEVIARAYKVLAKKYHPDMNPDNSAEAENKFKEITEAYEVLSDPTKKGDYDARLSYENKKSTQVHDNHQDVKIDNSVEKNLQQHDESQQMYVDYEQLNKLLKEHENALEKAYNDAYIKALQDMGYNVVYKKTLKERIHSIFVLIVFLLILSLVLFILFQIPDVQNKFNEIKNSFPFIGNFKF